MFIRQLTYLTTLAKEQHFTRAAERCNVSQPALSGAIKNLEEELGVPIVRRDRNFVGFTEEGLHVLKWAEQILANWDAMKQDASLSKDALSGTLRIGAIPTTLPIVALFTAECMKQFPSLTYQVQSLSTEQIIRRLDHFELDLGLTYMSGSKQAHHLDGFQLLPIYQERYVLLTNKDQPLAQQETVSWEEIDSLPLCLLSSHMQNRRIIDGAFRRAGVTPNLRVETDSILSLYTHLCHADLYSVVPHSLLTFTAMQDQLTAIPLTPYLSRDIGLITPDREPIAPMIQAVWNLLQKLDLQQQLDALISKTY